MSHFRLALTCSVFVLAAAMVAVLANDSDETTASGFGVIVVVDTTTNIQAGNGSCSLPEAIIATNTNSIYFDCDASLSAGPDAIHFALGPGTPVINIGVGVPLPPITQSLTINGNTGGSNRVEIRGPGGPLVSGDHGFTVTGNDVHLHALVITSAADDGILVSGNNFSLTGSYIGVFSDGVTALPNQGFGVQVQGSMAVIGGATNGGPCTGDCNVISGAINEKANVFLDVSSSQSVVKGNFIGTDVTGTTTLTPNITDGQGVADRGSNNLIGGSNGTTPGGSCTGDCNLISGHNQTGAVLNAGGILILDNAVGPVVKGNFVGTDVTGTQAIGNGLLSAGLSSSSPTAMIGGTSPEDRNVISGNLMNVHVVGLGSPGAIMGNFIGPDTTGTASVPIPHPTDPQLPPILGLGVLVNAGGATIGGSAPGAGNVISGNLRGVQLEAAVNTQIQGNLIGTAADGVTPLPNAEQGVYMYYTSSNNIVGGFTEDAGNTIAFNGGAGVEAYNFPPPVRSNTIRYNSIHSNAGKGISLLDSANDGLSPPVITGENPLTGTACAECFVDIYSDNEDEGRVHEGWVLSDMAGNWTFPGLLNGPNVTATNTDNSDNTSEFSAPFTVTGPTPTPSPSPSPSPTGTATATPTPTPSATPSVTASPGPAYAWGDANCSGSVDPVDSLLTLREDAGLPVNTNGCPPFGTSMQQAVASSLVWGDFDCSEAINPVDALKLLRFDAGLSVTKVNQPCPDGNDPVVVANS